MKEELLEPFLRWKRINLVKPHLKKNSILCDVGCGFEGTFLKQIRTIIKKGIGFDKKVKCLKDDILDLRTTKLEKKIPLKSTSVDFVTMLAVLEHLSYPKAMINESYRILKKKGKILITTPDISSKQLLEFLSFKLNIVSPTEILDHKQYFCKNSLYQLLKNAGFKNINIQKKQLGFNLFAIGIK